MEEKENQNVNLMVQDEGPIEKEGFSTMIWMILWYLEAMILMNLTQREKRKKEIQEVIKMIPGILK